MQKLRILTPACLLAAAFLSACAPAPNSQTGPEAGKAYYHALNCSACHRIGREGGSSAPDLTLVGFRKSRAWLETWLADPQAWKPGTLMPNPRLTPKTREGLIDYLVTLKGQDFAGQKPWDDKAQVPDSIQRGHVLFARAGCIACHGKNGAGGYPNSNVKGGLIPALITAAGSYTKEELKKKISKGVRPEKADPAGAEPLIAMPAWGEVLTPEEIDAVADYVISLKSQDKNSPSDW